MDSQRTCRTCQWFGEDGEKEDSGGCYRYPPVITSSNKDGDFPLTYGNGYCGEWSLRNDECECREVAREWSRENVEKALSWARMSIGAKSVTARHYERLLLQKIIREGVNRSGCRECGLRKDDDCQSSLPTNGPCD